MKLNVSGGGPDEVYRLEAITAGTDLEVKLSGSWDFMSAAAVRAELFAAVDEIDGEIVLDLAEVTFIDSSGLGLVAGLYKRRNGQPLRVRAASDRVRRLLDLTGLEKVIALDAET